ncbi:cytochrome P450 [Paraburkholderia sp. ZP32-5]|uniref:cytochrome P450 n=1 Tax=Paraburkholderia sp. ZP32-5 TaxID=2883245 RepID=UPI001F3D778A|nr:cytochrome P450 [Paraburkholderia sp. ZP32-5]
MNVDLIDKQTQLPTMDVPEAPIPRAPGSMPVIGHAAQLLFRPLTFLGGLAPLGGLVRVDLGRLPMLLLTDPELTRQVLNDSRTFDKGGALFDKVRELTGNSLLTSRYDDHKVQRRQMQPAFSRKRILTYIDVMNDAIGGVLGDWRDGATVDLTTACYDITARTASRTMFAADVAGDAAASLVEDLSVYLGGLFVRMMLPGGVLGMLPTLGSIRYDRAVERLHAAIDDIIEAYRKSGVDHGDLLSMMLAARDEHGQPWSHQEVHDQVITLFLAGIETTAGVMSWTLYLLSGHPEFADRAAAEVRTVLDGATVPQADHLQHLGQTRRAMMEALRLYPPGWIFTRVVTRDVTLGPYRLRPGDGVAYSPYVLHRNPALFEAPEQFDPDRWLPQRATALPEHGFIPFGGGVHKCIGDQFGTTEVLLALATILSRWHLQPVTTKAVQPIPRRATLTPSRFDVRIHER